MKNNEKEKTAKKVLRNDDYCVETKNYRVAIPAVTRKWVASSISLNKKQR